MRILAALRNRNKSGRAGLAMAVIRGMKLPALAACAAAVTGCTMEPAGLPSKGKAQYSKIAVVPSGTDRILSVYFPAGLADPVLTKGSSGRPTTGAIGQNATSLLGRAGAAVSITNSAGSPAARGSDAVVVLRQAPIDQFGLVYDPGRDFFAAGGGLFAVAVLAAGESRKNERYQPWTVVQIKNPEKDPAWMGDNLCIVGMKSAVLDPETGEIIREGGAVVAQEVIPSKLYARHLTALSASETETVQASCRKALQKAVSMALARVEVVK